MLHIGIEARTLQKNRPGTNRYVRGLLTSFHALDLPDIKIFTFMGPRPLGKGPFSKLLNGIIDLIWINIAIPVTVISKRIDILHMLSGEFSPLSPRPQIVSVMDVNFMIYPKKWDRVWRTYARFNFKVSLALKVIKVITISNYSKRALINYFQMQDENISVISPGINNPENAGNSDYHERIRPYLLYVGAIEPHKNLTVLIKAFALFNSDSKYSHYNLVFVGSSSRGEKEISALINELNICHKVIFTGLVEESILEAFYNNCSLFVFPSLIEGFGFPPLEAMIRYIPVVASDIPCHREVLGDGVVYFDPLDVSSLKDAITSVLSNYSLRQSLILRGIERAKKYSWVRCAKMTTEVYRQIARETHFVEHA